MMTQVKNYELKTGNGTHIRTATKVIFRDGFEVKFTERINQKTALRQAHEYRRKLAKLYYKLKAEAVKINNESEVEQ